MPSRVAWAITMHKTATAVSQALTALLRPVAVDGYYSQLRNITQLRLLTHPCLISAMECKESRHCINLTTSPSLVIPANILLADRCVNIVFTKKEITKTLSF